MHYCPLNSNTQQSVPSEQKGKPAKQAGRLYNNTVLILINTGPSNVKHLKYTV